MIEDVEIIPLKQICDDRGAVLHSVRVNDRAFTGFAEQYFSEVNEFIIKGWKKNKSVDQLFTVPIGDIKLVLYVDRPDSNTKSKVHEIFIGRTTNYTQVKIPKNVWYAFQAISKGGALISNIIPVAHKDCESINMPINNPVISYDWSVINNFEEVRCE